MGFLDRLFGREEARPAAPYGSGPYPGGAAPGATPGGSARSEDELAVERYRYLLRTAPPETIEQVHEEAFSKLTPDQRRLVFQQLSENAPAGEQPRSDDARALAQAATRSELRQPGTLERSLSGRGGPGAAGLGAGGMGFGGMFASSLLGSVAGYVIGSALVSAFLPGPGDVQAAGWDGAGGAEGSGDAGSGGAEGSGDAGSGGAEGSGDAGSGGDAASADAAGWDGGGGWDSSGGWDSGFGGGDFGGGDFGGGDFI